VALLEPSPAVVDNLREDSTQRVHQGRRKLQEHNTDDLLEVRDDVETALRANDEGMMCKLIPVCRCRDKTLELCSKLSSVTTVRREQGP
jgi:hypothetical protein